MQLVQLRNLFEAGRTPLGPVVDEEPAAAKVFNRHAGAIEQNDGRSRLRGLDTHRA